MEYKWIRYATKSHQPEFALTRIGIRFDIDLDKDQRGKCNAGWSLDILFKAFFNPPDHCLGIPDTDGRF